MALNAQIRDMEVWARNAGKSDRDLPENLGLDREEGWPVAYEQIGGETPERQVFNELFFELSAALVHIRENGLPLFWHSGVDYRHPSFVKGSDGLVYITTGRDTGPSGGNSEDPVTPGAKLWKRH